MSKKILTILFVLLFTVKVFGVYTAPNEDTVCVVGGLGTQVDKAATNGGGATKAAWDAGSPSDFIGANGGTITNDTNVTYDHTGNGEGERHLSKAGIGTGVAVGTLVYVSSVTSITTGIYEITGVPDNDAILCANIDATGDNADSTVNVGGALDTLQNALDNQANNAASYNRFIYYNISSVTIAAPIDIDTYGGSTTTSVIVEGYNATLATEAQVTITTDQSITALLYFNITGDLHVVVRNLILDAAGAGKADYCAYGVGSGDDYVTLENCILDDAEDEAGVSMNGDFWNILKCEIKECGDGIRSGGGDNVSGKVMGCSIHDNAGDGIVMCQQDSLVAYNLVYGNGGIGIYMNGSATIMGQIVIGNTMYDNTGNNFELYVGSYHSLILNNASVGSGAYGYDLNGTNPYKVGFGYNLSADNTSGHIDVSGTFADLGIGSNIASAQADTDLFTDVTDGAEDFTPKAGSDLIDNAQDAGVN